VRATARQISFADWELMRQGDQGVRLEPLLEAISAFLDDQRDVIECIRRDLVRGLKQPGSGRNGLTATQVLRSLVLMRLKNWDYRELRERIAVNCGADTTLLSIDQCLLECTGNLGRPRWTGFNHRSSAHGVMSEIALHYQNSFI
jgi:hypothetical protein